MQKKHEVLCEFVVLPFSRLEIDGRTFSEGYAVASVKEKTERTRGRSWRRSIRRLSESYNSGIDDELHKREVYRLLTEVDHGHRGNGYGSAVHCIASTQCLLEDHVYFALIDINEMSQLKVYGRYCKPLANPANLAKELGLQKTLNLVCFEGDIVFPVFFCQQSRRKVILVRFAIEIDKVVEKLADDVALMLRKNQIDLSRIPLARRIQEFSEKSNEYEMYMAERRRLVSNDVIRTKWPIVDVRLEAAKLIGKKN